MVKNNEQSIREAAYYIWQSAGCPQGNDEYFWSKAVEQVSSCSKSSCKSSSSSSAKTSSCSKSASAAKSSSCKSTSTAKKSSK